MKNLALTNTQQNNVLEHLHLVDPVMRTRIRKNESVYGLGYEDLKQEGYMLLCRAAASYDPNSGEFEPYAKKVIYNGLISHCRKVYQYESSFIPLITDEQGNPLPLPENHIMNDTFAQRIEMIEIIDLLSFYSQQYRGTTKRGIEALSWKMQGMGISEIADYLNVPPSHVGAWISKAKLALKCNPGFNECIRKTK